MIMCGANYLQNKYKIRKFSKKYKNKNVQEIKILFKEENNEVKCYYSVQSKWEVWNTITLAWLFLWLDQ